MRYMDYQLKRLVSLKMCNYRLIDYFLILTNIVNL